MWKRWSSEYLKALRERHNMKHGGKDSTLQIGEVVVIKGEDKNRGRWKIGIVERLIEGQDKVVRGAKVRVGQSVLERAIQHLYPLELSCDVAVTKPKSTELRVDVPEFKPKRDAAAIANCRIQDIAEDEQN